MTLTRQLLVMVGISVLLGLGARVAQEKTVPFWGFPQPVTLIPPALAMEGASTASVTEAFPPAERPYDVDLSTALGLYSKQKREKVHFIDARDPKLYDEGHIAGAANIPFEKLNDYQSALDSLPKDELAVLYCDGGDCHLSHDLAEHMLANGWRRVAVYTGGWAEWSTKTDFTETSE